MNIGQIVNCFCFVLLTVFLLYYFKAHGCSCFSEADVLSSLFFDLLDDCCRRQNQIPLGHELHCETESSLFHMWFPVFCFWTAHREKVGGMLKGQTKQSKASFSLQAEGKHSEEKGCGRVKRSSRCTDGLGIFIKPTRHHVRRALPKNVVPRWTASAGFIYYRAASP